MHQIYVFEKLVFETRFKGEFEQMLGTLDKSSWSGEILTCFKH